MNGVVGFCLSLLIVCGRCDDVRLGDDGRLPCPVVDIRSISHVIIVIGVGSADEQQVSLYSNDQNTMSSDKYILAEDFSAITVTAVTVSDEGTYSCEVANTSDVTESQSTTLTVYGKQLRYLWWQHLDLFTCRFQTETKKRVFWQHKPI